MARAKLTSVKPKALAENVRAVHERLASRAPTAGQTAALVALYAVTVALAAAALATPR